LHNASKQSSLIPLISHLPYLKLFKDSKKQLTIS